MRLDRVNLSKLREVFRDMVQEALEKPGQLVRLGLPLSPSDRIQIFLRLRGGVLYLAIRRPRGKEDPREIQALAREMGLEIWGEPYPVEVPRSVPAGPFQKTRAFLVAECDLSLAAWEVGESVKEGELWKSA